MLTVNSLLGVQNRPSIGGLSLRSVPPAEVELGGGDSVAEISSGSR
jgi:hypothetical protein